MLHLVLAAGGAGGVTVVDLVLAIVGSGGVAGTAVTLFKVRSDIDTAAVSQSSTAAESMSLLMQELRTDRNEWRRRALEAEHDLAELRQPHRRRQKDPPGT